MSVGDIILDYGRKPDPLQTPLPLARPPKTKHTQHIVLGVFGVWWGSGLEPNCARRIPSTVATQSLAMLNSEFIVQQSEAFASRVLNETPAEQQGDNHALIARAWKIAHSSKPEPDQTESLNAFMAEQEAHFTTTLKNKSAAKKKALATLCQVLLASNEFLYID